MSDAEQKLLDAQGDFLYAVRGGEVDQGADWQSCRLVVTNKRLILATGGNKQTVPLAKLSLVEDPPDIEATEHVASFTAVRVGSAVIFLTLPDAQLEETICRATLHDEIVLVKHPAVEGGVVQDTEWEQARVKIDDNGLNAALERGAFVKFDLDDISGLDAAKRTVNGEKKPVIEVSHTDDEGTSIETHVAGDPNRMRFVESWLRKGEERSSTNVDLSSRDREVLMALYSGVSPFEIPSFLGMDVDDVEETFERLVELEVVEEVRIRREVALNSRGRNIASEAMNEQ